MYSHFGDTAFQNVRVSLNAWFGSNEPILSFHSKHSNPVFILCLQFNHGNHERKFSR